MGGPLDVEGLDRGTGRPRHLRHLRREPVIGVALRAVAAVAGMDHHRDARIVHEGPERVERPVPGRAWPLGGPHRRRAHHDGACPLGEAPLEFPDGQVGIGQREVRGGEDRVLVGEAPVLLKPTVEADHEGTHRLGVLLQELLIEHAERGEQPHRLEALRLDRPQPRLAVDVLGGQRFPGTEQFERALTVRVAPEVLVQRPGLGDRIPRRVDHGVADPAADDVVSPTVHLAPLDDPVLHLSGDVAGEGVVALVVVVVAVEGSVAQPRSWIHSWILFCFRSCIHRRRR